jgi:hypothetical protein
MPLVRFLANYDHHIKGKLITYAYKAGQVKMVTTPCATAAVSAGKAVRVKRESSNEARGQNR